MFPRYLQYLLTDFRQTFVTGASWDTDDLITFLGQKVKVQGHTIAAEAHSTLPSSATFSSLYYEQRFQKLFYILTVEPIYRIFLLYHVSRRDVPKRTVICALRNIWDPRKDSESFVDKKLLALHRRNLNNKANIII